MSIKSNGIEFRKGSFMDNYSRMVDTDVDFIQYSVYNGLVKYDVRMDCTLTERQIVNLIKKDMKQW